MNVLEGNKLIHKFMNDEPNFDEMLFYDISWDSLMPVVEKIENMEVNNIFYEVLIGYCCCSIRLKNEQNHFFVSTDPLECSSKIEAVWQTVVKFIQNHV